FLTKTGITVLQHDARDMKKLADAIHGERDASDNNNETLVLRSHAYEVTFKDANFHMMEVVPEKPSPTISNYFIGNDPSKWGSGCRMFQAVTYKNIYPNIDVRFYTDGGTFKYDFHVHPGGNPARIVLQYNGVDKINVKKGQLILNTSTGELRELEPYTYQHKNSERNEVSNRYLVNKNEVKFDIKGYDPGTTLVIDPTLIFSTFSGSRANNWGFTATYGPDGSLYAGGIVFGSGFPTTLGSFQTSYRGGEGNDPYDMGIMKFNPSGSTLIYATYIGGASGNEQPHSLIVDAEGNLIIAGRTTSGANYPTTAPVFGPGGGADIVVTKLNTTGSALIGSMRIGGSGSDGVNITSEKEGVQSLYRNYGDDARSEVILAPDGSILVAGCTQSSNFPTTPGAYQSTPAGKQDAVYLRLNSNVSAVLNSTLLGGTEDDAAFVLSVSPLNGNVFIAGGTASDGLATPGKYQTTYQGGISDGFVAEMNITGTALLGFTYVGTNGVDIVYGIQFDKLGYPYVMGTTTGVWPVVNANYSSPGAKQFVGKFNFNMSGWVYSTVFGTPNSPIPNISPTAFLVDRCENVYVSGWGGNLSRFNSSTIGMETTPDALKRNTDGMDFYFIVIERNATKLLYATFFGQNGELTEHVDGGTSRFDTRGVIYQSICANCGSAPKPVYPTTAGAYSQVNPSNNCNLAALKISFDFSGVIAAPRATINGVRDTAGCLPLEVTFSDTIRNAVSYEWDFGDGSPLVIGPDHTVTHTFTSVGTFRVRLVASDPSSCNGTDTAYINIKVGNNLAAIDFNSIKLEPCESLSYRFTNLSVAPPGEPFSAQSFIWDFGDNSARRATGTEDVTHTYAAPGTYNVKLILVDPDYCNSPDSLTIQLRVSPIVDARFETPAVGCVPYTAVFENTSLAGQTFEWHFGDGTTSTEVNPTHLYSTPGVYTVRLIARDLSTCNLVDETQFTITVSPNPTADFAFAPLTPVENTPHEFFNNSSGATRYKWIFGDGEELTTIRRDTIVKHQYNASGVFNACLVAFNQFGCSDTACREIRAIVTPQVDVPNAFVPQGNASVNKVYVVGFGIAKMNFRIYNRQGKLVFETTDKSIGWDGRVNGVLQPMDVYTYTLDIEFFDGTRSTKKGDITLIR
ncbi:MAG TPA: PKD domain-containing protein, partial [Parasegetibacter sp.]